MTKANLQFLLAISSLAVALFATARAQQSPAAPKQDDNQLSDSSQAIQGTNNADKYDPDDRPLSGAEDLSLGTLETSKNVLNSSIRVDQRIDGGPRTAGNGYAWTGQSDVFGTLSLNRTWKRNSFVAEYDGGDIFYAGLYNQNTQNFSFSQHLTWHRWSLILSDQMTYSPESPFGMPGPLPTSINFLGTKLTFLPNQTIFTGQSSRVSNSGIGQLEYAFSRRSSFTVIGSYSLLRYTATSVADNSQAGTTVGYNYALTPRDKIAVTYGYQQLQFNYLNSKMEINTANLNYAHQVLGRMSLQIGAGAQLTKRFNPFSHADTSVSPDGSVVLSSAWRRTQLSLSASKSILSGAGLSVATNTTAAGISASRTLSRHWSGSVSGGYAENSVIGAVSGSGDKFRSGFAGVSLQRTLGRRAGISFLYNVQKQVGSELCNASICGGAFLRHSIGIGLNWNFKPILFQ